MTMVSMVVKKSPKSLAPSLVMTQVVDGTVGPGDAAIERDARAEDDFAHGAIVYGFLVPFGFQEPLHFDGGHASGA